jgi:hypothetical protein
MDKSYTVSLLVNQYHFKAAITSLSLILDDIDLKYTLGGPEIKGINGKRIYSEISDGVVVLSEIVREDEGVLLTLSHALSLTELEHDLIINSSRGSESPESLLSSRKGQYSFSTVVELLALNFKGQPSRASVKLAMLIADGFESVVNDHKLSIMETSFNWTAFYLKRTMVQLFSSCLQGDNEYSISSLFVEEKYFNNDALIDEKLLTWINSEAGEDWMNSIFDKVRFMNNARLDGDDIEPSVVFASHIINHLQDYYLINTPKMASLA